MFFSLSTHAATVPVRHEIGFVTSFLLASVTSLGLSLLLVIEQQRSSKPSNLAVLYLLASTICDVLLLTMPSGISEISRASRAIFTRCLLHFSLFLLECCRQRPFLYNPMSAPSPADSCSVLGRLLYTWINPILLRGYRNLLLEKDIPPLDQDMKPKSTRNAIIQTWSQRG